MHKGGESSFHIASCFLKDQKTEQNIFENCTANTYDQTTFLAQGRIKSIHIGNTVKQISKSLQDSKPSHLRSEMSLHQYFFLKNIYLKYLLLLTWTDYFYWADFFLFLPVPASEVANQSGALFLAM